MNARDNSSLESIKRTKDFCVLHNTELDDLPSFNSEVTNLGTLEDNIRVLNQKLEENTHGYTKAKNDAKESLLKVILPVFKIVQAYASVSKDSILLNSVDYSETMLRGMLQNILCDTCRKVLVICNDHLGDLTTYGLTEPMIKNAGAAVDDFYTKLDGTPDYIGQKKAARQDMDTWFAEANDILKNTLDRLIELKKDGNTELYVGYKNTRKPEVHGYRTLSLRVKVLLTGTKIPIPGASVLLTRMDATEEEKKASGGGALDKGVKISGAKGGLWYKSLAAGEYTLTVSKKGYTTNTITVYCNDGERTDALIELSTR